MSLNPTDLRGGPGVTVRRGTDGKTVIGLLPQRSISRGPIWAHVDLTGSAIDFTGPAFLQASNLFQSNDDTFLSTSNSFAIKTVGGKTFLQFNQPGLYLINWQTYGEIANWDSTTAKYGFLTCSGSFGSTASSIISGSDVKQGFSEPVTIPQTSGARNVNLPTTSLSAVIDTTFGIVGTPTARTTTNTLTDTKFDFSNLVDPLPVGMSGSFIVEVKYVGANLEIFSRGSSSSVDYLTIVAEGSSYAGTTSDQKFDYHGMLTATKL